MLKNSLLFLISILMALLISEFLLKGRTFITHRQAQELRNQQLYIKDPVFGFRLNPNQHIHAIGKTGERVNYDTYYTIDSFGRRVVPHKDGPYKKFIAFFGCSYTFGFGLSDQETLPFYVSQTLPQTEVYNYAVSGYGPQHLYLETLKLDLKSQIRQHKGTAIYVLTFYDRMDQLHRAILSSTVPWVEDLPRVELNSKAGLEFKGLFSSLDPVTKFFYWILQKNKISYLLNLRLPRTIESSHYRLLAALIKESRTQFLNLYPQGEFVVLIHPFSQPKRWQEFRPFLEAIHTRYLDFTDMDMQKSDYSIVKEDPHPSALANREIASRLAKILR